MNTRQNKIQRARRSAAGSVLVITLVISTIIGVVLTSYLAWISSRSNIAMRSLAWNSAMPVMEAGIEEALTHLHDYSDTITSNGWKAVQIDGKTVYQKRRDFTNDRSFCIVTISNSSFAPIIYSQGFVPAPYGGYISRMSRIAATNNPLFFAGLVTKEWIQMSGKNLTVDSYDSTDAARNPWSLAARGDRGDIATVSGLLDAFSVGNANIWGKIGTGVGGTWSLGLNGCVGDLAFHLDPFNNKGKIEDGWGRHDFNYNFPPIIAPSNGLVKASGGSYAGHSYSILLNKSTNYWVDDWTGDFCITPGVNATLSVYKSLKVTGNGQINFNSSATVKVYVYCSEATIGGQSLANQGNRPKGFQYYGMPSNKSFSFSGGAEVTACVYAPDADFSMSGAGSTPMDFSGSLIVKTLKMSGNWNVHYDESLAGEIGNGFVITSWMEL